MSTKVLWDVELLDIRAGDPDRTDALQGTDLFVEAW